MNDSFRAEIFAPVETWVFDLDNTLYPPASRLFDQVSGRMTKFIVEHFDLDPDTARVKQKDLFKRHGTTMRGLMVEHGIDPNVFLDYVHSIDVGSIDANPSLGKRLGLLPGSKLIFTNASRGHAERVLGQLGIAPHFEEIFDISKADYVPKPDRATYAAMLERHQVSAANACMVEDMAVNLKMAKELGMATVWLRGEIDWAQPEGQLSEASYIDYAADDLGSWLDLVIASRS